MNLRVISALTAIISKERRDYTKQIVFYYQYQSQEIQTNKKKKIAS